MLQDQRAAGGRPFMKEPKPAASKGSRRFNREPLLARVPTGINFIVKFPAVTEKKSRKNSYFVDLLYQHFKT
ncbi:MAG: hypothetical protein IPN95_28075 [Bacteroidetes bacterium]|nr:hypothetical protein [Bacteroidota bacterium]